MTAPWLSGEPSVNYRTLTLPELLALWKAHRNDVTGAMAADEVCRRLSSNIQEKGHE